MQSTNSFTSVIEATAKIDSPNKIPATILFVTAFIFLLTNWSSAPLALGLGLLIGMTVGNPFREKSQTISKILLQICVVGLGFSMNLEEVFEVSRTGFIYTIL